MLWGLLLWRLGGSRVADIAHRSMGLPSVRTPRRNTIIPRLVSSSACPTVLEVEENISACLISLNEGTVVSEVTHQVLMFDEIKIEQRPRWDDHTNHIQGICREHSKHASLLYTSNLEVNLLFEQILEGKVHLASNLRFICYPILKKLTFNPFVCFKYQATVGVVGILSENHRLYSALPALISGQCGRESGKEHAKIIQTTLDGCKKSKLQTLCISSDGESRRHEAFVRVTFNRCLEPHSNIYNQLHGLPSRLETMILRRIRILSIFSSELEILQFENVELSYMAYTFYPRSFFQTTKLLRVTSIVS